MRAKLDNQAVFDSLLYILSSLAFIASVVQIAKLRCLRILKLRSSISCKYIIWTEYLQHEN